VTGLLLLLLLGKALLLPVFFLCLLLSLRLFVLRLLHSCFLRCPLLDFGFLAVHFIFGLFLLGISLFALQLFGCFLLVGLLLNSALLAL